MPPTPVPLGQNAWKREYAGTPEIVLLNRFFEQNPTNLETDVALLARPGSSAFKSVGSGLHRGKFTLPGFMNGDLFVADQDTLYRISSEDDSVITINGDLLGSGDLSFAAAFGPAYEHLFIADGLLLSLYTGGTYATGTLRSTGAITSQVFRIGGEYYTWGDAPTVEGDTSADGTAANPWTALLGGDDEESLTNMEKLINFAGIRGTTYSPTLGGPSTQVEAAAGTTTLDLTSKDATAAANSIVTAVTSGADLAFDEATLEGGGTHAFSGVEIPTGQGARAVASLAGFVLVAQTDTDRFYWVRPGEKTIDGLSFATAESQPDKIVDLVSTGDVVWLLGADSSEVWYATGDNAAPFAPIQGRAWPRGVIPGTAVRVGKEVVVVGSDNVVYTIGGQVQRISHHGIEERIRTQLRRELTP